MITGKGHGKELANALHGESLEAANPSLRSIVPLFGEPFRKRAFGYEAGALHEQESSN